MKRYIEKEINEIDSEKIAVIAEKGLKFVKLSKKEKLLLNYHLNEFYNIKNFLNKDVAFFEEDEVEKLMQKFSFTKEICQDSLSNLWIRLKEKSICLVQLPNGWNTWSPQFAHRSSDKGCVSFHKKIGFITVHLEVIRKQSRLADLNVIVCDESNKESSVFEVSLFKGERCIETAGIVKNKKVALSSIRVGSYELRISDSRGELTSISVKMED